MAKVWVIINANSVWLGDDLEETSPPKGEASGIGGDDIIIAPKKLLGFFRWLVTNWD